MLILDAACLAHDMQVLDVVADSVGVFDEVNVATALHRLAKLQPPNSTGQASPVIYADHFQQLVIAIQRQLHRFEAQAVSNTLWGEPALRLCHPPCTCVCVLLSPLNWLCIMAGLL